MNFIDLKSQYERIRTPMNERIQKVLDHGQYIMGPEVVELEQRLAEFVGAKHCIAASSGTDTLLIAMMAIGIKPGDEVITSPFTFIATGEMIALAGAKPVFVDIDRRTYNLDPALIEAAITPRTKAIMPVSLYGQCADMDGINAVAAKRGLPVIEDAAQSFGAYYKGKASCAVSEIGSTSFFPSKPLGCYGDGGALFTNDSALAKIMAEIRVHGQDRRYHHPRLGINGRLDTLQAAVLLGKMDIFPDEVAKRAKIGARYSELVNEAFRGIDDPQKKVTTPYLAPDCTSVYAQYTVEVPNRPKVEEGMKARGVPTAVHYPVPLHLQPVFAELGQGEGTFPISESVARRVISLPMHPYLTEDQQVAVVKALKESVLA
ncbi:UDP-2-acetamido-2-deoxy-ribo-hexuluronate aminotransferase [Povalibacter uvarum]|uniref:UDP-2-acetamido-2-deoxy-ribo-hexuluronate aminotransferase n=1 Tax=Povalibacter uvarum TaxID=732238 RepID=A0A841HGX5_9GAMM|nr:DegT/DnrJ/EryC1/StrS family aminotransferase [Povalibacter uvarum]MBB6091590.1 UDP-2-acetamido-2-deoxy-ribo-hexuluronate aminotransferase [Povalibacter uvarum]